MARICAGRRSRREPGGEITAFFAEIR